MPNRGWEMTATAPNSFGAAPRRNAPLAPEFIRGGLAPNSFGAADQAATGANISTNSDISIVSTSISRRATAVSFSL